MTISYCQRVMQHLHNSNGKTSDREMKPHKLTFICSFMVKREVYNKKFIAKELRNIYITIISNWNSVYKAGVVL